MTSPARLRTFLIAALAAQFALSSAAESLPVPVITSPARASRDKGHAMEIKVSCPGMPRIQSVEIHANGRPIGNAKIQSVFTDWSFPNGGHLSLRKTPGGGFTGEIRNSPTSYTYALEGRVDPDADTGLIKLDGEMSRMVNGVVSGTPAKVNMNFYPDGNGIGFRLWSYGFPPLPNMLQKGCLPSNGKYLRGWRMAPKGPQTFTAVATFVDDGGQTRTSTSRPVRVRVTGEPVIEVRDDRRNLIQDGSRGLYFDWLEVGRRSPAKRLFISNLGNAPLDLGRIRLVGPAAGDYRIKKPGKTSLKPGKRALIKIAFAPQVNGQRNALIRIPSNAPGSAFSFRLTGRGIRSSGSAAPSESSSSTGVLNR